MPFDFNIFSSLLLPCFIQGILFASLLFYRGRREDKLSDKILGWLLLLNAIKVAYWMLGYAGWYDTHDGFTSFMFYFPFNNLFWIGPLLYFYFLSLTNTDFKFQTEHYKHFILPVLWLLLFAVKLIVDFGFHRPFADTESTQYGTKGPWADIDKQQWIEVLSYLSFFYYLFITIKEFRQYQEYVKQNFSATEEISFNWLRNLLYAISAGVIIFLSFTITGEFIERPTYKFAWYAYLGLGITIYYLSIAGYFIPTKQLFQLRFVPELITPQLTSVSKEEKPADDAWKTKLLTYMQEQKPYLEPELNLGELSKALGTNPSMLSKLINESIGQNFNDFINEYRVKEVIAMFKAGEHKKQTLLGVAFDCGFNSKATFNRAFKKYTGQNPKEFIGSLN